MRDGTYYILYVRNKIREIMVLAIKTWDIECCLKVRIYVYTIYGNIRII